MKDKLEKRINALILSAKATTDEDTLNGIRRELKNSAERYLLLTGEPFRRDWNEEDKVIFYTK